MARTMIVIRWHRQLVARKQTHAKGAGRRGVLHEIRRLVPILWKTKSTFSTRISDGAQNAPPTRFTGIIILFRPRPPVLVRALAPRPSVDSSLTAFRARSPV